MKGHEFLTREAMSRLQKGSPAISKIRKIELELVHIVFIIRARKLYILAKSDFVDNKIYLITLAEGFERPGIVDSYPLPGMTGCMFYQILDAFSVKHQF